jgi:hypothetical protein
MAAPCRQEGVGRIAVGGRRFAQRRSLAQIGKNSTFILYYPSVILNSKQMKF